MTDLILPLLMLENFLLFCFLLSCIFAQGREITNWDKRGIFPSVLCSCGDWSLLSMAFPSDICLQGSFLHLLFFQALLKYLDHLFCGMSLSINCMAWMILELQNTLRL